MKKLLLLFCLIGNTALAQVQPQFKFYLAFEDATGARDTIWVIVDSAANEQISDTTFGELARLKSFTNFQVFLWSTASGDSIYNTWADNYGNQNSYFEFPSVPGIRMVNGIYPITMSWDTNLLKNHQLAFEIKEAWFRNDRTSPYYYHFIDEKRLTFTYLQGNSDSLVLSGNGHFPMTIKFSKNWPWEVSDHLNEMESFKLSVYPNPAQDQITLKLSGENTSFNYQMVNELGNVVSTGFLRSGNNQIEVNNLASGVYAIVLSDISGKIIKSEKLIIQH